MPEEQETLLPSGGALLSIEAAGGADIPAFTLVVQIPEPMALVSPSTGFLASEPDDEDMDVSWVAGTGDAVLVTFTPLTSSFQTAAGTGLVCAVEGDPGEMTIPAAALQAITTDGNSSVALGVTRVKGASAEAGPWIVPASVTRSTGGLLKLK